MLIQLASNPPYSFIAPMSDTAAAPVPAEGVAPAGGPKAKLPLIAVLVVGLAVGAGSGAVVVGPMVAKKMGFTTHTIPAADSGSAEAAAAEEGGKKGEGGGEHGAKGADAAAPTVYPLENLVLNPAGSGGSRYLLLSITIECSDAKGVAMLTGRDAELKDLILTSLSKRTVDELSDVGGREAIKTQLIDAIRERFGKGSVKQLYFPQFVIQ